MKKNAFRLIGYEMRKSFLSPWMLLFLAGLLLMNGWRLSLEYEGQTSDQAAYPEVYAAFYSRWSGPITAEHIAELMTIYGPLEEKFNSGTLNRTEDPSAYTYSETTDQRFFAVLFLGEMRYDYLYRNQALEIVQQAKTLQQLYAEVGNSYEAAKNAQIARLFTGRAISQFADTFWAYVWLKHDFSAMLVLLLTLFGLCSVFVTERETEMYMLLRTARLGGGATVAAKSVASLLFVVLTSALFFAEDILVLLALSGRPEVLSSPVYALTYLEDTPLNMTVGGFMLWSTAVKTLGILGCGCVILLISCLCRHVLTAFVAGFGGLLALTVLQQISRTRFAIKWWNPMELVLCRELVTETAFANLFGQPVLLHLFVLGGVLLTMAVLYGLIVYCNPGHMGRRK